MINTILRQLNAAFGKAFLFSGLAPAMLLLALHTWYQGGPSAVEARVTTVFSKESAAFLGLVLVALALVFQAARARVTEELQSLPCRIPGFSHLRSWMIARQVERWRKARREKDQILWFYSVLRWHHRDGGKEPFREPKTADPIEAERVAQLSDQTVLAQSKAARDALQKVCAANIEARDAAAAGHRDVIVQGLATLYVASCEARLPLGRERLVWLELVGPPEERSAAGRILDGYAAEYKRRNNEAFVKLRQYPMPERMQPTTLGNQLAALDTYAEKYGIGTSTLWIRLNALLGKADQEAVAHAQLRMEAMVMVAASLSTFAVFEALRFMYGTEPTALLKVNQVVLEPVWRLVAFGALALTAAVVAYQGAIFASGAFAEKIVQLIDTKRLEVIKAAGFGLPATVGDEVATFRELHKFYLQDVARNPQRKLVAPDASPSESDSEPADEPKEPDDETEE